jgi:hypothetical protein
MTTYKPAGAVAKAFMMDDSFFRGIMGPFGSGKSTVCIMEILRRASLQQPGKDGIRRSRWAVIRNTYPELRTTTIKSWHQWVSPELGRWVDEGPPFHHIKMGDMDLEVLFVALDRPQDISKLLSMELTGAWVNEAREVPKPVIDGLTGRVGRYPSMAMGGTGWSGIIADTNPPDSDHWWYKLAEEDQPQGWRFFKQPGGLSEHAENREHLPDQYYERQVAGKDPDWVKVYVHGEYGYVRDGKPVYPEFKDSVHVQEFEVTDKLPLYIGIDFGLTPAATIAQRTALGQWRVHSELVTEDMGAVRFSEVLRRVMNERYKGFTFAKITGDPAGDVRAQTDEVTPFQILRKAGIPAQPAATNDFIKRRESVAGALSRLIDGVPGLIVHPQCAILRKAMAGGYALKRVQVGGAAKYRDMPDKNDYSHVAESLQYLLVGGGEARLLVKRTQSGPRPELAVME